MTICPPALGLNLSLCGATLRVSHGDEISIIQSIYLSGERRVERRVGRRVGLAALASATLL